VIPTSNKHLPKVLLVFLGLSKDTMASLSSATDWNPFCTIDNNNYIKSLTTLNNEIKKQNPAFSLEDFYSIDAFPLLYWNGSKGPSAKDYYDHFSYTAWSM